MLKDKLIYYPRRSQIKIGAVDGSNYFYCGTVGDWLDHEKEYSAQTLADLTEFAQKQRDIHAELCERVPDIPARLRAMTLGEIIDEIVQTETDADFRGSNRSALGFFSVASRWIRQISDARTKAQKAQFRVDNFVPFGEREVDSIFFASDAAEPDETLVFKIEGGEFGEYWTMDEAIGKSPLSVRSSISGGEYDGGEDDG